MIGMSLSVQSGSVNLFCFGFTIQKNSFDLGLLTWTVFVTSSSVFYLVNLSEASFSN